MRGFFQEAESEQSLVHTLDSRAPGVLRVSLTNGNGWAMENCEYVVVEGLTFAGSQHRDNSGNS